MVADRLFRFYDRCAASGLPEPERLAATIETWWPEIPAFIQTGITNAGSEGTNRVIKTVARDAYGFTTPTTSGYEPAAQPPADHADASTPHDSAEP